jgi:hypothetical protein
MATLRVGNIPIGPRAGDTCDYHDDHDEEDQPRGNRCGRPATKVIYWRDGRWSPGCDEHAAEIGREVPELVRSIDPLPAVR